MIHVTFACPDLITLARLDGLGLEVAGQYIVSRRAVLACRVLDPDQWCRRCGCEGSPWDTVTRRLAHEPFGQRPIVLVFTLRRCRCRECGHVWRQDLTRAAEPCVKLSRRGLWWALEGIVVQHPRLVQAKPYDPESKGLVERANQYLETSFLPGRSVASPADFNTQLVDWLTTVANQRRVRVLGARPAAVFAADLAAMTALPPTPPRVGERFTIRLGRDYYVRVACNDYSVDLQAIDRLVEVRMDLAEVTVTHQGLTVARHERSWSSGHMITDPAHVEAAARPRHDYQHPPLHAVDEGLVRDLAVYDQAFGLTGNDVEGRVA